MDHFDTDHDGHILIDEFLRILIEGRLLTLKRRLVRNPTTFQSILGWIWSILGWIWSILDWLWSILDGFWSILGWIKSIFDTECRQPRTRLVGWICQPCSGSTMATTQARSSLQSSSMVRVYRKCCLLCIYMPAVDRSLSDCSRAACTAATCGWDFKRGIDGIDGIDGIEAAVWWSGYGRPDYAGWGQFSMEESWFTIEEFEFLVEEFWFPI